MEQQSITLRDELKNRYINFVNGFGVTQYMFDFTTNKLCGEFTDWKEINVKENKKYRLISEIQNDRYYGNYNDGNYKNMAAIIYKVTYKKNIFSSKQKYIFMIIDNPFYNQESNKSAYKLIIFNINQQSIYIKYLTEHSIFSSI
jgi:hypothetical protein